MIISKWIYSVPEEPDEDAKPKSAPVFVSKPEPVTVEEGEWARFQARVTGHPKPRVMWLINGHTVVNVSHLHSPSRTNQEIFSKFNSIIRRAHDTS